MKKLDSKFFQISRKKIKDNKKKKTLTEEETWALQDKLYEYKEAVAA